MTARVNLDDIKGEPIIARHSLSMVCAGCDGPMTITKDAVGRERWRCKQCQGVSTIKPHPDDAQLPQGLVRANVVELPRIDAGQLRCQVCAKGLRVNDRFHPERRGVGLSLVQAMRLERNGPRIYAARHCAVPRCGALFTPTGPAAKYCEAHR